MSEATSGVISLYRPNNSDKKSSGATLGFVDRFSGTVILTGTVSEVEASLSAITDYVQNKLGFTVCEVTKT